MAHTDLRDDDPVRIGGALIVGRLGAGGMGVVYLGRNADGRAVAVKVVRTDLAADPDFRRRFADEVQVMRDVGPQHTARVLAADPEAAQPWVVMDYVQGPTLADRVRRGPLPADELDAFATHVIGAVAAVHAAGVVHRDLKPSNVVLTPGGIRLLDFGVARAPFAAADQGARVGSLTWMAPEQIDGDPCGPAADIHALGAKSAAVVTRLYDQLPANGSELVLFDINRAGALEPLGDPRRHGRARDPRRPDPVRSRRGEGAAAGPTPTTAPRLAIPTIPP